MDDHESITELFHMSGTLCACLKATFGSYFQLLKVKNKKSLLDKVIVLFPLAFRILTNYVVSYTLLLFFVFSFAV